MERISRIFLLLLVIMPASFLLYAAGPGQDYLRRNEVSEMAMENAKEDSQAINRDDVSLKNAIAKAFRAEAFAVPSEISVDTYNGVVILTGTTLNEGRADRVVDLARSTPGVKDVVVNIQVKGEKTPYQLEKH